jgi:hypothetical protein
VEYIKVYKKIEMVWGTFIAKGANEIVDHA